MFSENVSHNCFAVRHQSQVDLLLEGPPDWQQTLHKAQTVRAQRLVVDGDLNGASLLLALVALFNWRICCANGFGQR